MGKPRKRQLKAECPHCHEEVSDSPEMDFPESGPNETQCGNCGKPVVVVTDYSVTYEVSKVDRSKP